MMIYELDSLATQVRTPLLGPPIPFSQNRSDGFVVN
jgi:hypothetical protein